MATHSSILAWRIPGTEEPGRLPSMGSHRVRHDWSDLAAAAAYMNGLAIFPTFFNFSLNLAIRSSWSEPQSAPRLVFADCIELFHLWLQKIQSYFDTDHLMMSMCRVISCVFRRGCLLCLDRTLLAFAQLHFVLQGQTCLLLQVSLDFLLLFQSPMMKRTSFFGVSSRRSCKSS